MNRQSLVAVYTAYGQLDAETVRLFLNAKGVQAELSQEALGSVYGLTVGPLGEVKILVPEDQVEQATDLLLAMEAGEFTEPDDVLESDALDEEDEP